MSLRARPARWFEALIPRPSVARSVEILAASGCVQLEQERGSTQPLPNLAALAQPLEAYRAIRQRYRGYWPPPDFPSATNDDLLEDRLAGALAQLRRWEQGAAPRVQAIEARRRERHDLVRIADFLDLVLERDDLDLGSIVAARPPLAGVLLALADHAAVPEMSEDIIVARAGGPAHRYLLALGPDGAIRELTQAMGGREAQVLALPDWLAGMPARALATVSERIETLDQGIEAEYAGLATLARDRGLAALLGELRRLEWFARHLEGIPVSEYLARVTGWTSAASPQALSQPLQASGIAAVLSFLPAPRGLYPPTLTQNPWWARPFELFVRLVGTPGRNEADPTLLVALVAPLLFGYMFGDVGQGAILLGAGLLLRRRWPALGMLIPGGILAMAFGFVFGSAFCQEGLIHPLWLAPLEDPLAVLTVPLIIGAALILLSLVLRGVEEHWAGRGRVWLEADAGLIALYLGLLIVAWQRAAGAALIGAGTLWFVLGPALQPLAERRESLGAHAGELLERLLQLGVNTLSFVRVGAFAIAHAGLAAAVTSLALAAGDVGGLLVLALGNVLILALEGLVVSVQTTRLILFEFFVRFVSAGGRAFRALPPPSAG